MTVLDAIQKSTDFLARKGVDSPRLQSELLLAHVLKTERLRLYLDFGRVLPDPEMNTLRELVRRRGEREPLQHILGSTSFCGYEIKVSRAVLIPRPETELLAEGGWNFLQSLVAAGNSAPRFLDFGTGSGCIAIALAMKAAGATGVALDASGEALAMAAANLREHGLESRVELVHGASLQLLRERPGKPLFDLLISNPPYIPAREIPMLQEEVRRFDPHQALDGGEDGLDFYRTLAAGAADVLARGGRVMVEFGDGQEDAVAAIFARENWIVDPPQPDYSGRPRTLAARRKEE